MSNEITIKVMQWLESAAQQVGEFASKEIPPFVHEFLQWKFCEAAYGAVIHLAIVAMAITLLCFTRKIMSWAERHSKASDGASYLVPVASCCVVIVVFFTNFPVKEIKDMIQIKIAPKVYLVEKAAEILKAKP
jgi:hypothetical protein